MKLKIWQEARNDGTVNLRLFEYRDEVFLRVVNADGHDAPGGALLRVGKDGRIGLAQGVDPKYEFQLDAEGRVITCVW